MARKRYNRSFRLTNCSAEVVLLPGIGRLGPGHYVEVEPWAWDDLPRSDQNEINDLVAEGYVERQLTTPEEDAPRERNNGSMAQAQQQQQERDVVLWSGQYCFILSRTSGVISTYVGPKTETLDDNKRLVVFDEDAKKFRIVTSLEDAKKTIDIVPEGWYAVLKNPAKDGKHPAPGSVHESADLAVGQKINIPGKADFARFPGQMVEVIQGHQLRSNQYLVCRVYNEETAKESLEKAILTPQTEDEDDASPKDVMKWISPEDVVTGNLIIIKGTDFSFFIPPTGIEVLPDEYLDTEDDFEDEDELEEVYVRQAVTLEQLEYSVLLDEDGNKEYIYGPNVVFPKPTQKFLTKKGPDGKPTRKYRCIELNHLQGIYLKVVAPYIDDDGVSREVGEELFITGKEEGGQRIFQPRPEIAIIKYGDSIKHYAIAIPPGEARYSLNRNTGEITVVEGPAMWLPDPRKEVPIRRRLSPRQVDLMYPGNTEAKQYNEMLSEMMQGGSDFMTERAFTERAIRQGGPGLRRAKKGMRASNVLYASSSAHALSTSDQHMDYEQASTEVAGDEFKRSAMYTKSPSVALDTKYEGVVTVDIWNNYAVLLVSKTADHKEGKDDAAGRRVVVGPQTVLLGYDENPHVLKLSKGKPKGIESPVQTVYLRVKQNRVSDIIDVQTAEMIDCRVHVIYQLDFEGDDPKKWFDVEDYVKFITDNCRSRLRNAAKKLGIEEFHANYIDIVRDTILGTVPEAAEGAENPKREGRFFAENACRIYEVDVLELTIGDDEIRELLVQAQHDAVRETLELQGQRRQLDMTREVEKHTRERAQLKNETELEKLRLKVEADERYDAAKEVALQRKHALEQQGLEGDKAREELRQQVTEAVLQYQKLEDEFEAMKQQRTLDQNQALLDAQTVSHVAKVRAIQPNLIAAIQQLADSGTAVDVAKALGVPAYLEGESLNALLQRMLAGTGLAERLLKPTNGDTRRSSAEQPSRQ